MGRRGEGGMGKYVHRKALRICRSERRKGEGRKKGRKKSF